MGIQTPERTQSTRLVQNNYKWRRFVTGVNPSKLFAEWEQMDPYAQGAVINTMKIQSRFKAGDSKFVFGSIKPIL